MFEVIYMKAEFEPWWMFDGWEEDIQSRQSFEDELEAKQYLNEVLSKLRKKYINENTRKECFYAFWCEGEKVYCEPCGDDLQIFHGVILLCEGKPFTLAK